MEPLPPLLVELADVSGDFKFVSPSFEDAQWREISFIMKALAQSIASAPFAE
jgi:hypothetical protein